MPLIWVLPALKRDLTTGMAEPAARGLPWRGGSVSHRAELRSAPCTGPSAAGIRTSLTGRAGCTRLIGSLSRACWLEVHSTPAVLSPGAPTLLLPQPACSPA